MINKNNFRELLKHLNFEEKDDVFSKNFEENGVYLKADFKNEKLEYPELVGLIVNERQTCNFSSGENAVVFECVHKLLEKGYKAKHIELEPKWKLGHGASGGRADILVRNQKNKPILIIECKTYGREFDKAWKDTKEDGGQLFSYAQQISETEYLCLYASKFDTENNKIIREQRIISHKDNEKILEQSNKLKSFRKASNLKKRVEVWKETYQTEWTETGIFESNIRKYEIGKDNYTLDIDTRPVRNEDKNGKYHRFRTILRQHNIARRETAFEVLVNLFLAKIVDEEENKTKLEFYWKGVAYDNYYDFIDRLQKLYQIGMRKFLKDEVMYISNKQIDSAFWTVKNKRNATKKQIQKYFRDLKFFSNNAFSLINVHNERLFNQNTKVIVEIVQMWQNLRLKTKEQNQFLGDMFEYFLDNSIKQSEGQFFTPMPITKFIIASLPLEEKIKSASEPLKTIDFACGSGHFLTEYAHQIKPIVQKYKETDISKYYENTIGIEKEDRLAKIAKVSAYMYGQDQINILEKDALCNIPEIKNESFDILIANPPFAVEGFLLNLNDEQKKTYELIKTTELKSNTNNIQCFFIERAKHLMKADGIIGIILPSSILSNSDATHIGTREIILKYFDIVAIVELPSGTFGKTGTNTIVLYLKRKIQKPEPAEHYANRVEDYFESNLTEQIKGQEKLNENISEYQDIELIKEYCKHNKIEFEEYIKLFGINENTITKLNELFKTDIFKDYKKDFENKTDIKNYKKKKIYTDKTIEEKELEINKKLIKYIYEIEKNKLFYFILAHENKQKILIVKSPTNNKEQKKFLGYEWSGAKGNEGIKYTAGDNLKDIITPLFNPQNINDNTKINYLIQQNFLNKEPNDLKDFQQYKDLIRYTKLTDILDFNRTDFNKTFALSPKKNINIDTKWEMVKMGEVATIKTGKKDANFSTEDGEYPFFTCGDKILKAPNYSFDTEAILVAGNGNVGQSKYYKGKFEAYQRTYVIDDFKKINIKFAFFFIEKLLPLVAKNNMQGSTMPFIKLDLLKDFKIPLPPKSIQEQIVSECEVIDKECEKAQGIIDKAKSEIEVEVEELFESAFDLKRINSVLSLEYGISLPARERVEGEYPVYGSNGIVGYHNTFSNIAPCIIVGRKGSAGEINWSNKNCTPIDTTFYIKIIDENKLNLRYIYHILKVMDLPSMKKGSGSGGINRNDIYSKKIPVPSLSIQKVLVSKVEKLELKIISAREVISNSSANKQQILDKHLK